MATTLNQVLAGETVLLTRPKESSLELAAALAELGASVVYHPTITITPGPPIAPLILEGLVSERYDGIVFTSANSARFFLAQQISALPAKLPAFSVGPKTTQALDSCFLVSVFTCLRDSMWYGLAQSLDTPARCSVVRRRPVLHARTLVDASAWNDPVSKRQESEKRRPFRSQERSKSQ